MMRPAWRETLAAGTAPLAIAAAALAFPPTGEFPIVDDWDYRDTVVDLLREGRLRMSDWPAMTLLTHAAWGAAFAAVGGASHFTLRISSLAALALACLALYGLVRRNGGNRRWGVFAALAAAFSPPVWLYANTFMTDVTGMALGLATLAAARRCAGPGGVVRPETGRWLLLGAASAAAFLCRQNAPLPGLALAAWGLGRQRGAVLRGFWLPFAVVAGLYGTWLIGIHGVPYYATAPRLDWSLFARPLASGQRVAALALALGFFLAPLWLAGAPSLRCGRVWLPGLALAGLAHGLAPAAPFNDSFRDYGPALDRAMLGAETLRGPRLAILGAELPWLNWLAQGAAAVGLAAAVAAMLAGGRRFGRAFLVDPWRGAAAAAIAVHFATAALSSSMFDRYLLPLLALAPPLLVRLRPGAARRRGPPRWAWVGLALLAGYSLAGTADCFARLRAMWEVATALLARGVPARDINGSMEFRGVHCFAPMYRHGPERQAPYLQGLKPEVRAAHLALLSPLTVFEGSRRHAAAFAALAGFEVLEFRPFQCWLSGPGTAYGLRKKGGGKTAKAPAGVSSRRGQGSRALFADGGYLPQPLQPAEPPPMTVLPPSITAPPSIAPDETVVGTILVTV